MAKNEKAKRWRLALHEAGHLVTFRNLCLWNERCAAYIRDGGGYCEPPTHLTDANFAIGIAAGIYAERLAKRFQAPRARPAPAPTPATGATAEQLRAAAVVDDTLRHIRRCGPDDDLILARLCVKYAPGDPADWAERHAYFKQRARALVRKHAAEIQRVAVCLFKTGAFIYEGESFA